MSDQRGVQDIKVWDWSIRVFHWMLPLVLFALWYTRLDTETHQLFAQLLMFLLLYRLIWGVIGTPYARFKHFLYGPKALLGYIKGFLSRDKPVYASHNPLGGLMVVVLLSAMGFQLLTGLFIDDFLFPGPLFNEVSRATSSWMTDWHHRFFYYLLVLIGLHLTAILVYKLKGEGLVKAMITGRKSLKQPAKDVPKANLQGFPWWRFVLAVFLAALPVVWIFYWF